MRSSRFIRPIHPKSEIRPTRDAIHRILSLGWIGQLKIHGHRAQVHISADPDQDILVYNRHGQLHKKGISTLMASELRRVFRPDSEWNVIDAEWLKSDDRLFVFDFLKIGGVGLAHLNFQERWRLLPRAYISPCIQTLSLLTTLEQCMDALQNDDAAFIEGLVFRSPSPGFEDTSIVRCRR